MSAVPRCRSVDGVLAHAGHHQYHGQHRQPTVSIGHLLNNTQAMTSVSVCGLYLATTSRNQFTTRSLHVSSRDSNSSETYRFVTSCETLPANKPRPQSQVRSRDCRSAVPPAIFIPSALCRLTFQTSRLVRSTQHSVNVGLLLQISDGSIFRFKALILVINKKCLINYNL